MNISSPKEELSIRQVSWFLLGLGLLILTGIIATLAFALPRIFADAAVLLLLSPVAFLVVALFYRPYGKMRGFFALVTGFAVYYVALISLLAASSFSFGGFGIVVQQKSYHSGAINESTVELDISTFNGKITVVPTGSSSNVVSINASLKGSQNMISNIAPSFTDTIQNGIHVVKVQATQPLTSFFTFSSPSVDLVASVPANKTYSVVDLSTSNGEVTASSLSGQKVVADTSNGAINLLNMNFSVISAQTSNGEITGTISGNTTTLTTSNGAIDMTVLGRGAYTFSTSNGGIIVGVPRSLPVKLQASTSNGGITWVGPSLTTFRSDQNHLSAQTTNFDPTKPNIRLTLTTSNGGVDILSS